MQMSTFISLRVLRVTKLLPQPQETWVSKYLGWIPSFMIRSQRVSEAGMKAIAQIGFGGASVHQRHCNDTCKTFSDLATTPSKIRLNTLERSAWRRVSEKSNWKIYSIHESRQRQNEPLAERFRNPPLSSVCRWIGHDGTAEKQGTDRRFLPKCEGVPKAIGPVFIGSQRNPCVVTRDLALEIGNR